MATVLPRLLTVLLTKLLTRYLPSGVEFGEVSIIFSYIIFANVVLTYGMETAFFRFYSDQDHKTKTLGTALLSLFITTIIVAASCFILLEPIEAATGLSSNYWKWVVGIIAADALAVIPFAYMRAQNKSMRYALVKMVNVVITVSMSIVFFTVVPDVPQLAQQLPTDRIELFFIAFLASSIITLFLVAGTYFKKLNFDLVLWRKMLAYGWPILLAGLAFAINETLDKILLQKLLPVTDQEARAMVGTYSAGYRLAVGMTLFAQAFRLGVEPFFFSQSRDKNAVDQYALITKAYVALGAIALVAYVVLVDLIKPAIVDDNVEAAMEIVPLVLIAYFFSGIHQSLSVWYKIQDKTRYGAYISIAAAIVTIVLNLIFIPQIGYLASAYATCAAYFLMMAASYLIGRNHLAVPYELGNILVYLSLSIGLSLTFFYWVRQQYGIESLTTYTIGCLMVIGMVGLVSFRESVLIKKLLSRK